MFGSKTRQSSPPSRRSFQWHSSRHSSTKQAKVELRHGKGELRPAAPGRLRLRLLSDDGRRRRAPFPPPLLAVSPSAAKTAVSKLRQRQYRALAFSLLPAVHGAKMVAECPGGTPISVRQLQRWRLAVQSSPLRRNGSSSGAGVLLPVGGYGDGEQPRKASFFFSVFVPRRAFGADSRRSVVLVKREMFGSKTRQSSPPSRRSFQWHSSRHSSTKQAKVELRHGKGELRPAAPGRLRLRLLSDDGRRRRAPFPPPLLAVSPSAAKTAVSKLRQRQDRALAFSLLPAVHGAKMVAECPGGTPISVRQLQRWRLAVQSSPLQRNGSNSGAGVLLPVGGYGDSEQPRKASFFSSVFVPRRAFGADSRRSVVLASQFEPCQGSTCQECPMHDIFAVDQGSTHRECPVCDIFAEDQGSTRRAPVSTRRESCAENFSNSTEFPILPLFWSPL
nr:hypothetical protein Iba_chr15aCG12060 [Ipomoea batatas]